MSEETSFKEQSGCSEDQLSDIGLEWFSKHPCMTDAKMKSFMEIGPTESQILKRQKIEKDKIEKLVNRCTLKEQPVQFAQKENNTQLRIVLLGKVGVGKSSLGNLLTGQETFKAYNTAETGTVTISSSESEEFNVHVIDTPGLYDSENTDITTEIAKIFTIFRDGVHAFIITFDLSNPRITDQEIKVMENLQKTFGEKMIQHTFLAFTKAAAFFDNPDQQSENLEQHIQSVQKTILGKVLQIIDKNVFAVESKGAEYEKSLIRQAVLDLIRESVNNASEECYSAELFEEAKETLRREFEERQRKRREEQRQLHDEVVHLIYSALSKKPTGDLVRIVKDQRDEDICLYSSQVKSKVDGMTDDDLKELIRCEVGTALKESGMQLLRQKFTSLVKQQITDHQKDVEYHMVDLKGRLADECKILGEGFIRATVRGRVLERQDTEEAKMKVRVQAEIREFILANIHLHSNPTKIQQELPTRSKQLDDQEVMNMIKDCLQMPDVINRVRNYEQKKAEEKRRSALSAVFKSANGKVAELICDKTRAELEHCVSDEVTREGWVSILTRNVKEDLEYATTMLVSDEKIKDTVSDIFVITIKNVTNASFGQKVKMFFSPIFGFNYVKKVMKRYVPNTKK